MRQLKFRAWDTKNNNWLNPNDTNDGAGVSFNGEVAFRSQSQFGYIPEEDKNRFVIQEWTGIQDKNGKDIYEGDILKWSAEQMSRNNTPINYTRDCLAEVKFKGASFYLDEINKLAKYKTPVFWDGAEIIGNIFQNPELIQN